MLKILLVDDEDIEIHGLIALIKSYSLPLDICATARNGMEGLQKARELKPHIIITDLRMPKMNGTQMLQQLVSEGLGAMFVQISGFEDFDAARKGLELGTMAYLLKPVNRDELFRILIKCCHAADNSHMRLSSLSKNHEPYTLEEEFFVRRLLYASEEQVDSVIASQSEYGELYKKSIFAVATIEIIPPSGCNIYDYLGQIQSFAREQNASAPVVMDGGKCAIVLSVPAFVEENAFIDNIIKKIDELIIELYRVGIRDVFAGISDIGTSVCGKLPTLYKQSLLALNQRLHSNSHVQLYDSKSSDHLASDGISENQVITQIQKIIHEEFSQPLSIDMIAERLYLSPSHIRRLFKNKTGITIMEYLESIRLSHSRQLLAQRQYKIHEIGVIVGYESPSYFNVVFKKYYGQTPGEYRKSLDV